MAGHEPNEVLGGRYTLVEVLGEGGMGAVWRAEDSLLRREVAIKELRVPHEIPAGERDVLRQRMLREARAAAGLNHPSAVTIYDVIGGEDEAPYIVMELIEAPTLQQVVTERGPLSPRSTAVVGAAVADALAAAHARGIVHRDVKPANVMVSDSDSAKLTDFGIAAVTGDPSITATGLVLGSPSFMAPEQAQGHGSGPATDVWGLGATLYFALTARLPFAKGSAIATLTSVVNDDVPAPPGSGPVGELVCGMLAKDPRDRPAMSEVRERLGRAVDDDADVTTRAFAPLPEPHAAAAEEADDEPLYDDVPAAPPRGRSAWALALLLLLLAAGVGAFALTRSGSEDPAAQPQAADEDDQGKGRGKGGKRAGGGKAGGPSPTTSPTPAPATSAPTTDLATYESSEGFSIAYPADWEVVEGRGGPTSVDFVEPETNNYLRLAYRTPPGTDVLGTLEGIMDGVAARNDDYVEIRIEPTEFRGYEAALAEYTFAGQRAVNLQFVTGPPKKGEYGFALNFVTDEGDWESYAPVFQSFQETFKTPPGA